MEEKAAIGHHHWTEPPDPRESRGGTGGFVKNKGTELGVWLDSDVIVSCEACIVFGEYGGE